MLWNLDTGWLIMAVAVVGILSFIVAMALNVFMGEDGFGATGNAVIIATGFFLSIFLANNLGYRLNDLQRATTVGVLGAFACLSILTLLKAGLARLERR